MKLSPSSNTVTSSSSSCGRKGGYGEFAAIKINGDSRRVGTGGGGGGGGWEIRIRH